MLADKNKVLELIPQKHPMVMVDGLISADEEITISKLSITKDNIFCGDGFFQEPGLIENIAQTAALRWGYDVAENNKEPVIGYIGSVKRMIIYVLPKDNDVIRTKITVTNQIMNVTVIKGEVMVGTKLVAEGEMNIFLQ